jgi:putative ABC transport system ATP-binding protein
MQADSLDRGQQDDQEDGANDMQQAHALREGLSHQAIELADLHGNRDFIEFAHTLHYFLWILLAKSGNLDFARIAFRSIFASLYRFSRPFVANLSIRLAPPLRCASFNPEERIVQPVILKNVGKTYRLDTVNVPALIDINLEIRPERFTVIAGASGSGKTTLLNLIGCIDRPDSGQIVVAGQDIGKLSESALSDFRARQLGFIFQNFNLLPVLTAYENIEYPLILAQVSASKRKERVLALLNAVGLADRARNRPGQMSGGQRQRVAIARALATSPQLVLADEPTANLDSQTGAAIIALMRKMQREHKVSFVFSSHDPQVLAEADDAVHIRDGRIVSVERRDNELEAA